MCISTMHVYMCNEVECSIFKFLHKKRQKHFYQHNLSILAESGQYKVQQSILCVFFNAKENIFLDDSISNRVGVVSVLIHLYSLMYCGVIH